MDIRYFLIINFHPNNETNLIIMVCNYSFYFAKDGTFCELFYNFLYYKEIPIKSFLDLTASQFPWIVWS
jgi:hypothetical protein